MPRGHHRRGDAKVDTRRPAQTQTCPPGSVRRHEHDDRRGRRRRGVCARTSRSRAQPHGPSCPPQEGHANPPLTSSLSTRTGFVPHRQHAVPVASEVASVKRRTPARNGGRGKSCCDPPPSTGGTQPVVSGSCSRWASPEEWFMPIERDAQQAPTNDAARRSSWSVSSSSRPHCRGGIAPSATREPVQKRRPSPESAFGARRVRLLALPASGTR